MKVRNTQSDPRKNPDSPRVHGLRLTVKQQSLRSGSQTENSLESAPSPPPKKLGSPLNSSIAPNQTAEPFLDCTAAAAVLGGLHPKTVERWAREGRIPAYRYFRALAIPCFRTRSLGAFSCTFRLPSVPLKPGGLGWNISGNGFSLVGSV